MVHRIEETVARGICIGCGGCAAASNGAIRVDLVSSRMYGANLSGVSKALIRAGSRVCPFSDESPNEDALGAPNGDELMARDSHLGQFTQTFAGRVVDSGYLAGSSSGGLTSWLLGRLLDEGLIDSVINVGHSNSEGSGIFAYGISGRSEVDNRRKSRYYASSMAEVLRLVSESDQRFALVGVPCFIRAARALCIERPEFADRLLFFVGLVCGHYKTQAFAESLAWQLGVSPGELAEVDFRVKDASRAATDYSFGVRRRGDEKWRIMRTQRLLGGNWGHNAFQPEACNFCDDVVAECADVSFGDAWLRRFEEDSRGTNVVVSRNREVDTIFETGIGDGQISIIPLSPEEVIQSQAGGFRHRREGLALRLADDSGLGLSVPLKRVRPNVDAVTPRRAALLRQRRRMASLSHPVFADAVAQADLKVYLRFMRREIRKYNRIEAPPIRRIVRNFRRWAGKARFALIRLLSAGVLL